MMDSILTIVGPTASGKTAYAIKCAEEVGGEIISVDSRQIYRGFVIGTSQPTAHEQARVPHHLINILNPNEKIDAGQYIQRIHTAVVDIVNRHKVPILCGGTGLNIRTLRMGLDNTGHADEAVREEIRQRIDREGAEAVLQEFAAIDPDYAATIHPNNINRLMRAVEIYRVSGKPPSELHNWRDSAEGDRPVHIPGLGPVMIDMAGIAQSREVLYDRINQRTHLMIEQGWLEEVQALLDSGVTTDAHPMQGIGYRTLGRVIDGELDMDTAIATIQQETRQFAKRQVTWFKREPVRWIQPQ